LEDVADRDAGFAPRRRQAIVPAADEADKQERLPRGG
jgi:hypothetical protein